ncbi:MAG: hypothetical protein WCV73_01845 [Patescibacteria group bacterium]|jgi:hypothetical protein
MFDPKTISKAPNLVDGIGVEPMAPVLPSMPSTQAAAGTEDIFAEADPTANMSALKPKINPINASAPVYSAAPPEPLMQLPDDAEEEGEGHKKFFFIGLIILLAILAAGGYFVYAKFFAASSLNLPAFNVNSINPADLNKQYQEDVLNPLNDNQPSDNNANANADNGNVNDQAILPEVPGQVETDLNNNVNAPAILDSDKDGLDDEEEATLSTNPNEPDSDGDGLFDREEVKVYLTDPLNPDSDGDGYLDGAEVKGGYNPKGAGKLLDTNF